MHSTESKEKKRKEKKKERNHFQGAFSLTNSSPFFLQRVASEMAIMKRKAMVSMMKNHIFSTLETLETDKIHVSDDCGPQMSHQNSGCRECIDACSSDGKKQQISSRQQNTMERMKQRRRKMSFQFIIS